MNFPTTRPFPKIDTAVFATVICFTGCSMKCCVAAWTPAWSKALIDIEHNVIMDVELTLAHRSSGVESTKSMIDRVEAQFDIKPERPPSPR
jgi:hypothetical protein